jgi:multiple sugar transport system substrate-binding protein
MAASNVLRFLGRAFEGFQAAIGQQADAWPDGTLDTRWLDLPELEDRLLRGAACLDGSTDIVLAVTDWLPRLVESGRLLPLDGLLAAAPPDGWPDGWSPSMRGLTVVSGQRWGMAYHDGPEVLLYRTDLFGDPAEQRGFRAAYGYPLAPPRTWAELLDQARWFTRPDRGLWGTVLGGHPDGHNNVYDFLIQLWSRGGELLGPDDEPLFGSRAGLAALDYLGLLWNEAGVIDPAARSLDSVGAGMAFAAGQAAVTVNWAGYLALSAPPDSPTHGRVGVAPVPAAGPGQPSVSLNVFWALAIPAGCRRPELAWSFLRHAGSAPMDRITSLAGANGTRLSTWRDPQVRASSPAYAVIEEVHRQVRAMPQTTALPAVVEVLNRMVDDVVNRRASRPELLDRAVAEVRALRKDGASP